MLNMSLFCLSTRLSIGTTCFALNICVINHHWFRNYFWPVGCQTIIWTNAGIFSIGPLGTNFSEILIKIHTLSLNKIWLKISSGKFRPFSRPQCLQHLSIWQMLFRVHFRLRPFRSGTILTKALWWTQTEYRAKQGQQRVSSDVLWSVS